MTLTAKVEAYLKAAEEADIARNQALAKTLAYQKKVNDIIEEQTIVVDSLQALKEVIPLLSHSSVERAQRLADSAIKSVFQTTDELIYVEDTGRFIIRTELGDTDLLRSNGGGYKAVVSFVFQLFLLIKESARRFMFFDERFTALSDDALARFIVFLNKLCAQLNVDILLITHDARIQVEDVQHAYFVADGTCKCIK